MPFIHFQKVMVELVAKTAAQVANGTILISRLQFYNWSAPRENGIGTGCCWLALLIFSRLI